MLLKKKVSRGKKNSFMFLNFYISILTPGGVKLFNFLAVSQSSLIDNLITVHPGARVTSLKIKASL